VPERGDPTTNTGLFTSFCIKVLTFAYRRNFNPT
jgi:hypothetical protein